MSRYHCSVVLLALLAFLTAKVHLVEADSVVPPVSSIGAKSVINNINGTASTYNGGSSAKVEQDQHHQQPSGTPNHQQRTCSTVHPLFEQRGFNTANMPTDPVTDRPLRYCDVPPGGTCCTHTIETKLAVHAKTTLERNTKDSISKLSSVLGHRAQKFNGDKPQ
ncbi:uncharacterized protein LOC129755997 isoform X2 [Uranotaenia lowii]|uniref:uncharacterized protein LOC129755997 isoform X2 n=1 Tax=Uranotaenia lowii TaxID=190385 RepID=UPI002478AB89|nr:uncharacterized protein LOC129755997 isoform X2 [Uranotaenia lowii]